MAEPLPRHFINRDQGCDHVGEEASIGQCRLCDQWCCANCIDEHLEDEHGAA